jgi:CO/xanthine dehydrogenase Mo-binding subunit
MSNFTITYSDYTYIGKNTPRKDARDIVTGKATFLDDFEVPNMIYGRVLRSPYAHAMIKSIDIEKAMKVKGVHAVLTHKDMKPEWKMGYPPQKLILDPHLRYVGDFVAFIAADTEQIADEAMELIEVEYEVLPAVFNGVDAAKEDAPQLYPGFFENNEIRPGWEFFQPEGLYWHLQRGDVEEGFKKCEYIVEDRAEFNKMPNPMAPETPGAIVKYKGDNNFHVWATSQGAYICKLFNSFAMPDANFDVETFNVGGSYGNKQSMTAQVMCGALLSMATDRPVKVMQTKPEQLLCFENRLGSQIEAKIGIDKEGIVRAVKGKWFVDTGAYSNCTQGQVGVGLGEAQLIMGKCTDWDFDSKLTATNRTPAGIARGYGGMELNSCLNLLLCRAMEAGNFDHVDVYEKNYISHGDRFVWRDGCLWKAHSVDYKKAIRATAEKFGWKDKWKGWGKPTWVSEDGKKARGIGIGIIGNADAGEDNNECYIRINPNVNDDGATVMINMDVTESGMGQRSNLIKMAAEVLNVPYEVVDMTSPGTGVHNPNAFGLCGSRGTITYGRAIVNACEDLRNKLFTLAEPILHVPKEVMILDDFGVRSKHRPEKYVKWKQLIPQALTVTGYGRHIESFGSPSVMVTCVEVEVDLETGKAEVVKMTNGTDVGQIIDPAALELQLHGAIGASCMDSATFEQNITDEATGRIMNGNMIDYKWRTFNNFPEFTTTVLESQFDTFQFKATGIAEISGGASAPAVIQAISNAIGKHVTEYPATPDVILKTLGKL